MILVIQRDRGIKQGNAENILTDDEILQHTFGPNVRCAKGEDRHFVLVAV